MYSIVDLLIILEESIRGIDSYMESIIKLVSCVFEVIIFDTYLSGVLKRKYRRLVYNIFFYVISIIAIYLINSFNNTVLNFVFNIIVYFVLNILLFEGGLKAKLFYYIVFYTAFAGIEIIFEFILSFVLGEGYNWNTQPELLKFIIICLEKLTTFVILFLIKKRMNKDQYGMNNRLLLYSFVLPIATFWVYSALFYSDWLFMISGMSEVILIIGCILLLFSNAIIFLIYDYIFRLSKEKRMLEMVSLKTEMEKKYYERIEKVSIEQAHYMHDIKSLLKTIGNLAKQEENEEITTVLQDMKIKIDEMENEFFCSNKVMNTILCEKKRESRDVNIKYDAYVEPGVSLDFVQDIDIIIIMGNLIDNAIEAAKKVNNGHIDIKIFGTQKGHFLVIRIENEFNGDINRHMGKFVSTKEEPGKHGMGISNAKKCVEKYGGFLQVDIERNLFIVSVVFTVL